MVSVITVPCNFGLQYLHDPFHGNVFIQFNDGTEMKVNSLILSWNSITFSDFFNDLRLTHVKMNDFSKESAMMFLECLYGGVVHLENSSFRELYKISLAFQTKWVSEQCVKYFSSICKNIHAEYLDLKFIFEEACHAKCVLKTSMLIEIVIECYSEINDIVRIFVVPYLQEFYSTISPEVLDLLLITSKRHISPVIGVLKQHLAEGGIDDTSRSLLTSDHVVDCFATHPDLCEDVYELLVVQTENMTADDFKMITRMSLCLMKGIRNLSKTSKRKMIPSKNIPNLIFDENLLDTLQTLSDEEIMDRLSSVPGINGFMIIEMVYSLKDDFSNNMKEQIAQIFDNMSLGRIPSIFVTNFFGPARLKNLPNSVVSDNDSAVIIGTETTTAELLATTTMTYKFYFQHPESPTCDKPTQCGFMLKVTPCSKERPDEFNIQLVTDESEYTPDIHCHSDVLDSSKMHLVIEYYSSDGRHCNSSISWRSKPKFTESAGLDFHKSGWLVENRKVRFVVYYDTRNKKR